MAAYFDTPRLGDRLEAVIKEARAWSRLTAKSMRMRVASLTLSERINLEKNIKGRVRAPGLELQRISFVFPRHGIFLEHGVGRGRPVGSAKARQYAKPWIKPELDDGLDALADLLSEEYADLTAAEMRLLIPGIIDTKIKLNG